VSSSVPAGRGNPVADAIAASFVAARLGARALPAFPGDVPEDLAAGYDCQDRAIARWPEQVAGWKVGYIAAERRDASGEDRVTGPVFADAIWPDRPGEVIDFPVFVGGFAAVEAEYAFVLAADVPVDKFAWTPDEAGELDAALHIAVETAGSPLATINVLGPTVVATDFGNNAGLIVGKRIDDWRNQPSEAMRCETWIEGECIGRGGAASIPGGLLGAFAFALGRCARRGFPLRAGDIVTTGAATGIHDIRVGQHARVRFGPWGEILCRAVAAQPRAASGTGAA
jgi:2-keto-4-pentenoate hydratase